MFDWDLNNFQWFRQVTLRGPLVFCYSSSQVIAIRQRIFPHNSIEFCEVRIAWSYTYVQTHLHDHGVVLKQRINLEFLNFDMIKERLLQNGNETFSRAFTKLRNATIIFVMSVRPSHRTQQLVSYWTDVYEFWYPIIFRKFAEKIQVSLESDNSN